MNPTTLLVGWLDARPRARAIFYDVVLWTSVVLFGLAWVLPRIDVDHIWRIDLHELGQLAIFTAAAAGWLAKRHVPPTSTADDGE